MSFFVFQDSNHRLYLVVYIDSVIIITVLLQLRACYVYARLFVVEK